jgi:hypothetical protein
MSSVRVNINIELSQRSHITALLDRAAHDDQFFYRLCKAWFLADRHCDVGQRANGEDADLTGFSKDFIDQKVNSVPANGAILWFGKF